MIALIIPKLIILTIIITIILLILKKWRSAIVLLIISIIANLYFEFISISLVPIKNKTEKTIMIATHNIYSQGGYLDSMRNNPDSLYKILKSLNVDILLIQEFDSDRCARLTEKLATDGYRLYQKKHELTYGENAIYSRIPLRNIQYHNGGLIMHANFSLDGRTGRIINCHLSSNNINDIITNNNGDPEWIKHMPQYIASVSKSSKKRTSEALVIKNEIDSCSQQNMPVIVAGDMNDVGGSAPIKIIEGKGKTSMYDAWWHSGNGIGNTYYNYGWLNFRLDHIFYSKHFDAVESKVIKQPFSDHEVLVSKLQIN